MKKAELRNEKLINFQQVVSFVIYLVEHNSGHFMCSCPTETRRLKMNHSISLCAYLLVGSLPSGCAYSRSAARYQPPPRIAL